MSELSSPPITLAVLALHDFGNRMGTRILPTRDKRPFFIGVGYIIVYSFIKLVNSVV
jgi:hypothetical protein